ncbi:hypothetical protein ONZ45_g8537 [Pleurotus djamor]|nr:hypothetical protein ONZ45_g8537 [Pleurotus djamor]
MLQPSAPSLPARFPGAVLTVLDVVLIRVAAMLKKNWVSPPLTNIDFADGASTIPTAIPAGAGMMWLES